jgi:hypothetical protein
MKIISDLTKEIMPAYNSGLAKDRLTSFVVTFALNRRDSLSNLRSEVCILTKK